VRRNAWSSQAPPAATNTRGLFSDTQVFLNGSSETNGISAAACSGPARRRPDRIWKPWVIEETRNHMPVKMRYLVTEGREVDFIWLHNGTHSPFYGKNHLHEVRARVSGKIRHLFHVRAPDHSAKPGVVGIVNKDDTAMPVVPKHVLELRTAYWAWGHGGELAPFQP